MRTHWFRVFPVSSIFFLFLFSLDAVAQLAPNPLITRPIDETQVVTLRGNTHPLAQPQFDIGSAPPDMPLNRMLLVLKRAPQQDYALKKLLDDQQDRNSPNYRKWLTPDQFGQQFGATDQDLQIVAGWLETHGFEVSRVSHGRSIIEFSGVESQLEGAFHTQIHQYLVNGQTHWANATDPQIPVALAPAVAGLASLNNFPRQPMSELIGTYSPKTRHLTRANPLFTLGCGQGGNCYAVGPADFGTIYSVESLWNSGIEGTGQTIAIVGESDINLQDDRDFRNLFGLPANDPQIIYDGPNPGFQPDESEADIDVEWSGAIAPKAAIDFVVSASTETTLGVDLSAIYIIDNNLAPVMSESYGECELAIGTSGNQFYNSLWGQAAAQGITAILAAGDSGSATCDRASQGAQYGLEVSGFASTPYNVAIGGTDFNDFESPQQYWNLTNTTTTQESAKTYIPETTWNNTCTNSIILGDLGWGTNAESNCNDSSLVGPNLFLLYPTGGGGGVSSCTVSDGQDPSSCSGGYSKPSWQSAPGVPADGKRDVPDVSLFAANGIMGNFYIFCEADSPYADCPASQYGAAGGTSFGAPAFAGIMALVNQQMQTPQGNANYVLYKLAAQQNAGSCNSSTGSGANCVFNDITSGTIAMPCVGGSPNCTVQIVGDYYGVLSGYSTGTGYDLATGLGSINVANLVKNWNTVTFRPSLTTISLNPTANLTHGQAVTVTGSVKPGSGSGTPTGAVSLLTSTGVSAGGFTLNNGGILGSTTLLPGGSYSVTAHYAGDATFGGSDSTPVSIAIGKENSGIQIDLITFDWNGNLISANASSAVYGSPYLLRVDVLDSQGVACQSNPGQLGCPTGNVTLTDNGNPLDAGTYALNSQGYTEDQAVQFPTGNNSVKAQYAGDGSFNASASATTTYNITPAVTTVNISASANTVSIGTSFSVTATVSSLSLGTTPSGTVAFFVDGQPSSPSVTYTPQPNCSGNIYQCLSATATFSLSNPGNHGITASYNGDTNYQSSASGITNVLVQFAPPNVVVQASSASVNAGSNVTLTATVTGASKTIAPSGAITFVGNQGGPAGTVSYATVPDPSTGYLDLQGSITFAPTINNETYSAQYSGDTYYPAQFSSNSVQISVNGSDFSISANQTSVSVFPGNSVTG